MTDKDFDNLLSFLVAEGYLKTPAIADALQEIDRKDFVPHELKDEAYGNYPLPIGAGQTISQPLTVVFMLELLQVKPGENILEIGSGSGWQTALLARLVGDKGRLTAIERIPELKAMSEANVLKYSFIKKGIAKIILGDGSKGFAPNAPYHKIIAGAAAAGDIPSAWKEQLAPGGRIVAPVLDSVVVIDKTLDGKFQIKRHEGFSFVPLIED